MLQQGNDQDFDIIIIECCENCQSHQYLSRHSQWKYFQQFNQLKRKIQRFVNNAIVIKNPIPDQLIKSTDLKNQKNAYINKDTNQKVIFPRVGSFQIYIYNILIYSKLSSGTWPNHYKIIQILNKITQQKKLGNNIDYFSVYQPPEEIQIKKNKQGKQIKDGKQSKQIKQFSSPVKKKKGFYRVYKSKDKQKQKDKTVNLTAGDFIKQKKSINLQPLFPNEKKGKVISNIISQTPPSRYLQTKGQTRVKLPSLNNNNTISFDIDDNKQQDKLKKIFNSIQQIQQQQISLIQRKPSLNNDNNDDNRFDSLILNNNQSMDIKQKVNPFSRDINQEDFKFIQNKSVQYSQQQFPKQYMNTSIQYQDDQQRLCDFGIQIDDQSRPKQNNHQFIQTILTGDQCLKGQDSKKPYMLDQQVQAYIPIEKDQKNQQVQTKQTPLEQAYTNTQILQYVNRGFQHPEIEVVKGPDDDEVIDTNFAHLYQKKRNIVDNQYYSVDKFQEKNTKYKWVGRANINQPSDILRKRLFLECLVFSVYNFYGIKTPEKRMSFQHCGNVVADKVKQACFHILTLDNPQLHYLSQFDQYEYSNKKFPLSELLTFKNSKQIVKFNNYGGLLAVAYLLNDTQIFDQTHTNIGIVITNQQVKQIHKLSASNYQLHSSQSHTPKIITVSNIDRNKILYQRLSQKIQYQFISMLARIVTENSSQQLHKYITQIFIKRSNSYQQYQKTLDSIRIQKIQMQIVQDFLKVLKFRQERIKEEFKGQLYAYNKYRSLSPNITYSLQPESSLQRRMQYEKRSVSYNQVVKHIKNKDNIVIITGQSGIGKTCLMYQLSQKIKQTKQIHLITINQFRQGSMNKYQNQIQANVKNIIFIDNLEKYSTDIIAFISNNSQGSEISYCLMSSSIDVIERMKNQLKMLRIIHIELLPLSKAQLQTYLVKSISNHSYTDKKDYIEQILNNQSNLEVLGNALYARQYCRILSSVKLQQYNQTNLSKHSILKQIIYLTIQNHKKQMKNMNIKYKQTTDNLRRIALQYFHNNFEINQVIRDIIEQYQADSIIKNQLGYYPIQLDTLNHPKYLFTHQQYFNYYLIQSYSYFLQRGFRRMKMEKLFRRNDLMQMITQKYKAQRGHGKLLQVIYNSRKFKNTYQQASNAITLLSKMNFIFTNLNFDQVQIPDADLSDSVFYNCSFRGANMEKVLIYRTQIICCLVDNTNMSNIDLFCRKFQLEFLALTTSVSPDGKNIALGCGNYLIILNSQNGREIKRIQAHLDVIRTVRYSKDGQSLVTIADDKTLRIWDIHTYRSVVFKLPQKGSISFSNETQTIASITKHVLKVWNLKSMAGQVYCQGHDDIITNVNFSRDGKMILTGSRDTTLRLWNLQGIQKGVYKGHNSQIIVGRISYNNKLIFSSSKDKDLIVWNLQSKSQVRKQKFSQEVCQICPDQRQLYIVITFTNQPNLMILDYQTLEVIHILKGHQGRVLYVTFDNFYKKVISLGKDKTLRIWDFVNLMKIQTKKTLDKIHKGPVLCLATSKVQKIYATSHQNGQINIWNTQDNTLINQYISHNGAVKCIAFDKNNKLYSGGSDGFIRIWTMQKKQPKQFKIHSQEIVKLKISNKSKLFVSSSTSNQLVIHDITGTNIIMSTREEGRVYAIDFSKEDKYMAIGGSEKFIVIYQVTQNGNTVNRLEELGQHADVIESLLFQGDQFLIAGLKNGQISIWNHPRASLIKKIQNVSPIKCILAFQKKYICLASQDGKIRIIDMNEGKQVKMYRYSQATYGMDINTSESILYTGTAKGNILLWNLNNIKEAPPKINFARVAIDNQSTQIATIESSSSLQVRDLINHKEQLLQLQLDSQIQGVTFIDDKIILELKNGRFWQVNKGEYHFPSQNESEGDLLFMKYRKVLNLFRTPMKKLKGIKSPIQLILQEQN